MGTVKLTREAFLRDRQGNTFADVANDPQQPFDVALEFFNNEERQRRMEESELHHDRAPLAGVVRELESVSVIDEFLGTPVSYRNTRFRQAVGVLVRMIMEGRGWKKTGRKGSLGVRADGDGQSLAHNSGGLAFWFVRAERYECTERPYYLSVKERCAKLAAAATPQPKNKRREYKPRNP